LSYTLRILPFGSEELGLSGRRFYVQELNSAELENTKLMLNFDALSTGSGVAIFGDGVFTDLINEKGSEAGVPFVMFLVTTLLGFTPGWLPLNPFSPRFLGVRRRCFSLWSSRS